MLTFEEPQAFLWLVLIPLYLILKKLGILSTISFPLVLSDWKGKTFEWKHSILSFVSVFVKILFGIGFVLICIALANPIISHQEKVYTSRGTEIVFVIDTSPSMAALDIGNSNRLEAAKQAVKIITENNTGAAFGLVAMASEAVLLVPPTMDQKMFLEQVSSLRLGTLGEGTAIGTGITSAVYHLVSSKAPKKCIVLLSDGENNAGSIHPLTAASIAKENNITVYTLAVGTKGSVPVEYSDPNTGKTYSGYLESGFDTTQLKEISAETQGTFYSIDTLTSLSQTLESITKKESVIQTYQLKVVTKNYYTEVLLAAILILMVAWFLRRVYMKEVL